MLSLSDALEFAKFYIFGIGIHHTSLLGIWFAWTLSVLALIFVKAMRGPAAWLAALAPLKVFLTQGRSRMEGSRRRRRGNRRNSQAYRLPACPLPRPGGYTHCVTAGTLPRG